MERVAKSPWNWWPNARGIRKLVGRVHEMLSDETAVGALYNTLMARELSPTFNAKYLNIAEHSTELMRRVQGAAVSVSLDALREHLGTAGLTYIPEAELIVFFQRVLRKNPEAVRHMMPQIGWSKVEVKWGGVDYARPLWLKPDYAAYRGKIIAPDGTKESIQDDQVVLAA